MALNTQNAMVCEGLRLALRGIGIDPIEPAGRAAAGRGQTVVNEGPWLFAYTGRTK